MVRSISSATSKLPTCDKTLALWPNLPPATSPDEDRIEDVVDIDGVRRFKCAFNVTHPEIEIFLPPPEINTGAAVVVCPGGGFLRLELEKEGYEFANWSLARGIAAIVVKYRQPHGEGARGIVPYPLQDAQRAMRMARANASEWKIDPQRIGVIGFSSGGYLVSILATHFDTGIAGSPDPIERFSSRPDYTILVYSAVSNRPPLGKKLRTEKFLGSTASEAIRDEYSADLHITDQTPPAFIVQTLDDPKVDPANGLVYCQKLLGFKIPCELHTYATGSHGFGMGIRGGQPTQWPSLLHAWLKSQDIIPKLELPTAKVSPV